MLAKSVTGITGLDDVTHGGLPRGRTTLVCGGPGCGKTVLAMEFVVRGALERDEPGLFVSFEESARALTENFASFGFDLERLVADGRLHILHVPIARADLMEAGEFSLDALFLRIEQGLARVGAKRVAIDTLETLFSHLDNKALLRGEIGRLAAWLKERGATTVITAEGGTETLSRNGLEEYVSDCVLSLDHRATGQITKRRLRILKYRGSSHGMDEYPFLIGRTGISVVPISAMELSYPVSTERLGTGVPDLDRAFGGLGYFRGSSVLISGTAGTGKTTLAAAFAAATCARGERCMYMAFEEPPAQLVRNLASVSIELETWRASGALEFHAFRPTVYGLEEHVVSILDAVDRFDPHTVVMDPITNFVSVGQRDEVKSMLSRVLDGLKARGITALFTSLTPAGSAAETTETAMSSLMDTWVTVNHRFDGDAHRRELRVIKSRGMAHAHDAMQLVIASSGLSLVPRVTA